MNEIAADGGEKRSNLLINVVSVAIPLVVAILLGLPNKPYFGDWTRQLPHLTGAINTLTTITLVVGFWAIKTRRIGLHQAMMMISFILGVVFLVTYVTYHLTNPANKFNGEGAIRAVYLFVLVSHVGLSLVVLPLVLRAMYFATLKRFDAHRRVARFAMPIWLYVSVTGVLVYAFVYHLNPAR